MAQDRSRTAGEQRRSLTAVRGGHRVPDQIDATVNFVQPPVAQSSVDVVASDPGAEKLTSGDDTVLACRELGNQPVTTVSEGLVCHVQTNPSAASHAPNAPCRRARTEARMKALTAIRGSSLLSVLDGG